jgi:hypothetical protein
VVIFPNGGEIRTDSGKHLSAGKGAKSAGDFLLDFDHADVPLRLVIGEGNVRILKEGQDERLVLLKAKQEILGFRMRGTTAPLGGVRGDRRVFPEPGFHKGSIFSDPGGPLESGGRAGAVFLTADGPMHSEEKTEHSAGPFLMKGIANEKEFPEKMGVTKSVIAGEGEITA